MKGRQEAGDIDYLHVRMFYNNNNNFLIMNGTRTLTKRQIFLLHLLLFVYLFLTRGMFV